MHSYSAYINDKPILFRDVLEKESRDVVAEGFRVIAEADMPLEKVVSGLEKNKEWKGVVYLSASPEKTWLRFAGLYTLIEAAGGLVYNPENKYLVIFRRGKWDLPKGKIDYDESPKEAALREVEEECGVSDLRIERELPSTFHTYPQSGKRMLKKTHWYLMRSEGKEKLVPQLDEDILEVLWMSESQIRNKVFGNTFRSVRLILNEFFGKG